MIWNVMQVDRLVTKQRQLLIEYELFISKYFLLHLDFEGKSRLFQSWLNVVDYYALNLDYCVCFEFLPLVIPLLAVLRFLLRR